MSAPVRLTAAQASALQVLSYDMPRFVVLVSERTKQFLHRKGLIVRGSGIGLTDAGRAALAAAKGGGK